MSDATPTVRIQLTYTGLRAAGGKREAHYIGPDGKVRIYKVDRALQKWMMGSIGTVYEVDETPDGKSIRLGSNVRVWGYAKDAQLLSVWRAAHQDAVAQLEKRNAEDPLKAAIAPLHRAYWALPAPRQAQLIAWIVRQIVTGGKNIER